MPRFAHFDPTAAAPRQVIGWYDTDALHYPNPPGADALAPLTDEQWDQRLTGSWAVDAHGQLIAHTPPPPPQQPYPVPKLTIVNRLSDAGLLRTAYGGLKLEAPSADLTDAEFHLRERWNAAAEVMNTDQDVRQFLVAIGADVDAILAVP
jgi:hypothetical protein